MDRLDLSRDVRASLSELSRRNGETEDRLLRRLLGLAGKDPGGGSATPINAGSGFEDTTYAILFPEGFEISRTYKGRPYAARVVRGRWRLDADGRAYDSLNQLSQAVIDGNENAWMFWFTRRPDGTEKRIAELRDPALVQKRPRRKRRREWVAPSEIRPQATPPGGAPGEPPSPVAFASPLAAPSVSRAAFQAAPSRAGTGERPETPGGGKAWEPAAPKQR